MNGIWAFLFQKISTLPLLDTLPICYPFSLISSLSLAFYHCSKVAEMVNLFCFLFYSWYYLCFCCGCSHICLLSPLSRIFLMFFQLWCMSLANISSTKLMVSIFSFLILHFVNSALAFFIASSNTNKNSNEFGTLF